MDLNKIFEHRLDGEIIIKNPCDMHLHLREGDMLTSCAPFSARDFALALVMPNTKIPITNVRLAMEYRDSILQVTKGASFVPFMSLYLHDELERCELEKAISCGIRVLKLYPRGATTNSEFGVSEVLSKRILDILHIAKDLGFILSIHGESGGFCMDREFEFLVIFEELARSFKGLKIIIEHMSDYRSIELLGKYENLYATITLHHMLLSLDDVLGGAMKSDLFCKPMLKTPKDQQALLSLALEKNPKVSFGSDSAPHLQSAKYSPSAPGGIFSAPIALLLLAQTFSFYKKLENLQSFVSDFAISNYGLESYLDEVQKNIRIRCANNQIPKEVEVSQMGALSVLFGGNTLQCVGEVI